jgi:hypothetical protein
MLKYVFCFLICVSGISFANNIDYYKMNPQKIEKELVNCPDKNPSGVSCFELRKIAAHMNELAISLQLDPQAYGRTLLALQEKQAKLVALKNTKSATKELLAEINDNQQDIFERLTIIKWLESPSRH